jgi:hypothetical protein
MNRIRLVTVCTRSRLAEAAVLARSLEAVHPGVPRLLVLVEREKLPSDEACGWDIRLAESLPIPNGPRFLFQYPPFELCCALKPFALDAALRLPETGGAVYLDGDMFALAPFLDLIEAAWVDADVWLTPHLHTGAPAPDYEPFHHLGSYNAGFQAVANRPDGLRFLQWFQERLARDCMQDFRNGLFVDQKWLDLAAATCSGVRPLAYRGINTGHWNLHEHQFEERANGAIWMDGSVPLALFHFSGLASDVLSRYGTLATTSSAILALADRYRRALAAQAARFPVDAPYTFGRFSDGSPVLPAHREAVRLGKTLAPDPFRARAEVEHAAVGVTPPVPNCAKGLEADLHLRRLRAHPVIGRVWRFWKHWVNHDLP